jgi:hypothetical protein
LTVDEELTHLEDYLRKLKIEYDIYFGGGSKRPPTDLEWRVQSLLRKFSDSQRLNFSQRFRFNSMQQKYAIFSDLWRQKVKIREEGYRRPQDALLAIQGLRGEAAKPAVHASGDWEPLKVQITDPKGQGDTVRTLFDALATARSHSKETAGPTTFESFSSFVNRKTQEIRTRYHCEAVEYEVEMREGKVKLVARPKS